MPWFKFYYMAIVYYMVYCMANIILDSGFKSISLSFKGEYWELIDIRIMCLMPDNKSCFLVCEN